MIFMKYVKNILLCATIMIIAIVPAEAASELPEISADAAMVINSRTGQVLYEKNADKREYPTSLTKVMTAIVALEAKSDDRHIEISKRAGNTPFATYARAGQVMRQLDMMTQMLLISDNVAASALAEAVGGSEAGFAKMMNSKAKEIGAERTNFVNPHGLPDDNHYTTARDMISIARYAMKKPTFRRIVGSKEITVYNVYPAGSKLFCENTNDLLYDYKGCIGIKTGWTTAGGGCLLSAAERNGQEVLVVVLHSSSKKSRFTDAIRLLDYGFSAVSSN